MRFLFGTPTRSDVKKKHMAENEEGKAEADEGKGEKFFKEFGKKIDQFVVELRDASDRMEVDFKKRFEDLKKSGEKLKSEMRDKEKWKEVEVNLKKAGKDLENAFKAAFRKNQKDEPSKGDQ